MGVVGEVTFVNQVAVVTYLTTPVTSALSVFTVAVVLTGISIVPRLKDGSAVCSQALDSG